MSSLLEVRWTGVRLFMLPLVAALAVGCGGPESEALLLEDQEESDQTWADASITGTLPIGTVLEATRTTNLRSGTSSKYASLAKLFSGHQVVTVVYTSPVNNYYRVRYNGIVGWGYGPHFRRYSSPPPADAGSKVDAGSPFDAGTPKVDAGTQTTTKPIIVDLRADVNRDGVVSLTDSADELGEDTWTATRGAVFLANIDDDQVSCPTTTSNGTALSDAALAKCNDAADEVINGPDDLLDLARLRVAPWPDAPSSAVGRIVIPSSESGYVRLFKRTGSTFSVFPLTQTLTAAELRAGVELAIEGKDIVRDAAVWNGFVSVTLRVTASADAAAGFPSAVDRSDVVKLRVSPVMLFHHLQPAESIYVSYTQTQDSYDFVMGLSSRIQASGSGQLLYFTNDDQWAQDFFETGYMSMPKAGGGQHVIRVNFRSANVQSTGNYPLRPAGRLVFTALRGKDSAGVQQYDPTFDSQGQMDTLDSFGNTETIPPFTHNGVSYPFGRILRGSVPSFRPDPSFTRMLQSQNIQPEVNVDTAWLLVGHVDETISFVKAATPRGWVALVNDARLARQMLEAEKAAGRGNTPMFVGKQWLDDWNRPYSAQVTINQVLADTEVMSDSAAAAAHVDAQLSILKSVTGLTDAEIIRVPFLHQPVSGYSLAFNPGTVNSLVVNAANIVAPDPFGPVINGQDIFKKQLESALAGYGITVRWLDDWNLYHRLAGEVHCGTNAARVIPSQKWWESGR